MSVGLATLVRCSKASNARHVWNFFEKLSAIPRPSKHEAQVVEFLRHFAQERGLRVCEDDVGNVAIHRPGQHGGEDQPPVIVQGHIDMVTEKEPIRTDFDFFTDPIELQVVEGRHIPVTLCVDGGGGQEEQMEDMQETDLWVKANGTTLGADNGIGVAMALALLDDSELPTPPLECVFTVDEETGLTGAFQLDPAALELTAGSIINLDTEEWGVVYNGCAGGGTVNLCLPLATTESALSSSGNWLRALLRVGGLRGGHSGVNIGEHRGNAVKICAEATAHLFDQRRHSSDKAQSQLQVEDSVRLVAIDGGLMHNAIPRDCVAVLDVEVDAWSRVQADLEAYVSSYLSPAFHTAEQHMVVQLEPLVPASGGGGGDDGGEDDVVGAPPLTEASARNLLDLLTLVPNGPLKLSHWARDAFGDPLVETSNNLASVETRVAVGSDCVADASSPPSSTSPPPRQLDVVTSARSFYGEAVEDVNKQVARIAARVGATAEVRDAYPAWTPAADSPIVALAAEVGQVDCVFVRARVPGWGISPPPTLSNNWPRLLIAN